MSNDLIQTSNSTGNLLTIIENAASNEHVDADKMMKLIDVQERIYDKNAQIAFNKSMALCQQEMPTIVKDAENQQTNSKFAKYETIIINAKPVYTKHGFSLSFGTDTSPIEGHIRVTCEVMHESGHCKNFYVDLPPDQAGIKGTVNKTAMHATGSTYSYGKRYLFCMIFNIAIANEDDDGVKAGAVTVQELLEYMAFVRSHFEEISQIKSGLANENYEEAAMAWCDLTEQEKRDLWKAPTKGGILTTDERKQMRESEFLDACKMIMPGTDNG